MTVVLDASFCLDWLTASTGQAVERILPDLALEGLLAPSTFWHEVASGLRHMSLRGAIPSASRAPSLRRVRALGIELETAGPPIESVMAVSDRYQLTIYDAAYLELAIRTGSRLATRDNALIATAPQAKVALVAIP